MRRTSVRVFSFMMAAVVAFSGINITSFAAETEVVTNLEENGDASIELVKDEGKAENPEPVKDDEQVENPEPVKDDEQVENPEPVKDDEQVENPEPVKDEGKAENPEPVEDEGKAGSPEPVEDEGQEERQNTEEEMSTENHEPESDEETEEEGKDETCDNPKEDEKESSLSGNDISSTVSDNTTGLTVSENTIELTVSDNTTELTVSENTIELTVSENTIKKSSMPKEEEKDKKEYNDLLSLEMIPIVIDKEDSYVPEELVAIADSMPSYLSDAYDLYGDSYTSYYIYNQLDKETRDLWRAMEIVYSGHMADTADLYAGYASVFKMKTNGKDIYGIMSLLSLFRYTHPQYYYLSNQIYCNNDFEQGDTYIHVGFGVYNKFQSGQERKAATEEIESIINSWSAEIASKPTEEEKIRTIHNKICDKVDYNYGVTDKLEGEEEAGITNEEEQVHFTQSAYSEFAKNLTVCAGYTQAFTWLCNAMDIEAFGVTSPGHAWNKVKVSGEWYNVDCTWDDGVGTGKRDYDYYLRSDAIYDNDNPTNKENHQEESQWIS